MRTCTKGQQKVEHYGDESLGLEDSSFCNLPPSFGTRHFVPSGVGGAAGITVFWVGNVSQLGCLLKSRLNDGTTTIQRHCHAVNG